METSFELSETPSKKPQKNYNVIWKWQDIWVMWFVWVEVDIVDGVMVSVKYMIHEAITSWPKHIVPKKNNLNKHMGKWWAKCDNLIKALKKDNI